MLDRGAEYILGVDTCKKMIAAARELQSDRDKYVIGDAQNLDFLSDNSFDLAVSYLNSAISLISRLMSRKCTAC